MDMSAATGAACHRLRSRGPRSSLVVYYGESTTLTTGPTEVSLERITEIGQEIEEAKSEVEAWQQEIAADQCEADRIMERIRERHQLVKASRQKIAKLEAESVRLKRVAAELTGSQVGRLPLPAPVSYREGSGSGGGSGGSRSRRGSRSGSNGKGTRRADADANPADADTNLADANANPADGDADAGADADADTNADPTADADGKLCWTDVVNMLNLTETPFLKPLAWNTLKARREYNKLVSDEDQLGTRARVPGVGILKAAGLNESNQHLAKQFGALIIAANARHLVAGGAITDIIIFRTSGGGSPAALVTEAGLAAVRATAHTVGDMALRVLCKPPGKRKFGQKQQPLWEKMNVMAILEIEFDFLTGLPLLDTRAVTNSDSGLSVEEQDAFLSSLSHLLHDLAASLKPESKVDPGASAAEFFKHLEEFRASARRKRLRSH